MIAQTEPTLSTHADQTSQRLDLHQRFIGAGLADPTVWAGVPPDALLFLLPDDNPAFVAGEIAAGLAALARGQDVYFRHVRVADWPPVPATSPSGPLIGERHVTYDQDGAIVTNLVYGENGWQATDEPPPGPRDDDPAELWFVGDDRGAANARR